MKRISKTLLILSAFACLHAAGAADAPAEPPAAFSLELPERRVPAEAPLTDAESRIVKDAQKSVGGHYTRAIAKDHVNMLRIVGEPITDVIYDTAALEIDADKTRGFVYLRVKPEWRNSGKWRTAAFFTTANDTYGFTFLTSDVSSQMISIPGKGPDAARSVKAAVPAMGSLESLRSDSHVGEMKSLIRKAALFRGVSAKDARETGTVFSEDDPGFVSIAFTGGAFAFEGFEVRQSSLYATDTRFVEVYRIRNLKPRRRAVPIAALSKARSGVLAIAASKTELDFSQTAVLYLVVSRLADNEPMHLIDALGSAAKPEGGVK